MNLKPFLIAALFCMSTCLVIAQHHLQADEKTIAYLRKFRADHTRSMIEKKPELLQTYYAENIRLMPEFQMTIMGESNAISYQKAFLARFDIADYKKEEIEILDLGSRIIETGHFNMSAKWKSNGKEYPVKGKYLTIWEKLPGNNPVLITDAWNYDHQFEIEDQFRFADIPFVNVSIAPHVPVNNAISFELAALNSFMEVVITQHDAKIWSQFYSDDGMFLYSRSPLYNGRKALDSFLTTHVAELPIFEKLDIRNDRIDDLGDFVIEYASHNAIIRAGDFSGVFTGKDLRIWRREKSGSLKIFRGIAMYD